MWGSAGIGQGLEAASHSLSLSPPLLQMETVKHGVDQKLVDGQEKLHQMWLSWNQKDLRGTEENPAKPEVPTWGACGILRALTSFLLRTSVGWTYLPGRLSTASPAIYHL